MYQYNANDWYTVYPNSNYTIVYTTTDGRTIYRKGQRPSEDPPELDAGDTSELDGFLGGFANAQK